MKPAILCVAVSLPLLLAGCGIPDLVAHGVKSYEGTQEKARQYDAEQPASPAQASPASHAPVRSQPEPPPAASEAVPPRESVVAEPLR